MTVRTDIEMVDMKYMEQKPLKREKQYENQTKLSALGTKLSIKL